MVVRGRKKKNITSDTDDDTAHASCPMNGDSRAWMVRLGGEGEVCCGGSNSGREHRKMGKMGRWKRVKGIEGMMEGEWRKKGRRERIVIKDGWDGDKV